MARHGAVWALVTCIVASGSTGVHITDDCVEDALGLAVHGMEWPIEEAPPLEPAARIRGHPVQFEREDSSYEEDTATDPPWLASTPKELASTSQEPASTSKELASTSQELASISQEHTSTSQELASTSQGLASTSQGLAPTSQELASTSQELASTSQELASTSQGLASTSQEVASTSQEVASTSQEVASTSQGLASTPQGLASTPQGPASTPQGLASTSQGLASTPQGLATTSQGLATTSQGLATTSQVVAGLELLGPVQVLVSEMVLGVPSATAETVYAPLEAVQIIIPPGAWVTRAGRAQPKALTLTMFLLPPGTGHPLAACGAAIDLGPRDQALALPVSISVPCATQQGAVHRLNTTTGAWTSLDGAVWGSTQAHVQSNNSKAVWGSTQALGVYGAMSQRAADPPRTVESSGNPQAGIAVGASFGALAIVAFACGGVCSVRQRHAKGEDPDAVSTDLCFHTAV